MAEQQKQLLILIEMGIELFEDIGVDKFRQDIGQIKPYTYALVLQTIQILKLIKISVEEKNLCMLADMSRKIFEISKRLQILHTKIEGVPEVSYLDYFLSDAKKMLKDAKRLDELENSDRSKKFWNSCDESVKQLKDAGTSSNRVDKATKKWEKQFPEKQFEIYTILCQFVHDNIQGLQNLYIRKSDAKISVANTFDKEAEYWLNYLTSCGLIFSHSIYEILFVKNSKSETYLNDSVSWLESLNPR